MLDIKVLFNNLDKVNYEEMDIPSVLEKRDEASFHNNWVRVFIQVQVLKKEKGYPEGREQISKTFRKRSFQKIYKLTSDMGLAMEVSEDFSLMYDGLVLKYEDEWFEKLLTSYENACIPCGEL